MKRNKHTIFILLIIGLIFSFGVLTCKGYRTQKGPGKNRAQGGYTLVESGLEGVEAAESSGSSFSEVNAIEWNIELQEISGCTATDCEHKGYVRDAHFEKPINFNAVFIGKLDGLATVNHGLEIIGGESISNSLVFA